MTRLEQALRWWANADSEPIPIRHMKVLEKAGRLKFNEDEEWYELVEPSEEGGEQG